VRIVAVFFEGRCVHLCVCSIFSTVFIARWMPALNADTVRRD